MVAAETEKLYRVKTATMHFERNANLDFVDCYKEILARFLCETIIISFHMRTVFVSSKSLNEKRHTKNVSARALIVLDVVVLL